MEFEVAMMPVLIECSRQKLRTIHMSLLKYGSNVDERINDIKDVISAFQENNVKLPSRALQLISEIYEDSRGIDFQRIYKHLEKAHNKTGRDSVVARQLLGDWTHYNQVAEEVKDVDFLRRIEEQLLKCPHYYDLAQYRKACLEKDTTKTGKLSSEQMKALAVSHFLPIYGALLTNLLNRCDDENNGYVSWPEFINFLLKSMDNYCAKYPNNPKPGTAKPKPEQVEPADSTAIDVQTKTKLSKAHELFKGLPSRLHVNELASQYEELPDLITSAKDKSSNLSDINLQISKEESEIPTKEFIINGQRVALVIPADIDLDHPVSLGPPKQRLKLDWVYGYNGKDVTNNMYIISSGELLYAVGHIAVLLDIQTEQHNQRHYKAHESHITCMSVHQDQIRVASGQCRHQLRPAHIRIWRSDNLQTISVIEDEETNVFAYTHLSFCLPQGKALTSMDVNTQAAYCDQLLVGEIREKVFVSVWDIRSEAKIAETKINTQRLCSVEFNPSIPHLIVTLGQEHFQWWRLNKEDESLDPANEPNFGMHMKAKCYSCSYHTADGDLITGDSNGTVYVWPGGANTVSNLIKHAHEGSVSAVCVLRHMLVTCGKDKVIKVWKYGYHLDKITDIELARDEGYVKSMLFNTGILFLGTSTNTLTQFSLEFNSSGYLLELSVSLLPCAQGVLGEITSTHSLCAGGSNCFLVSGSKASIVLYNSKDRMAIGRSFIKDITLSSMAVSESGDYVCLGTSKGTVILMRVERDFVLDPVARVTVSKSTLNMISLSPADGMIAAVCNCTVYIILEEEEDEKVQNRWVVSGKFKVSSAGKISHLDWSRELVNGTHILRIFSEKSLEVTLWDPLKRTRISAIKSFQSCSWTSQKCLLTYPVVGVWYNRQCRENGLKGVDVNSDKTLIAVCDRSGWLYLFEHPCTSEGAFCHSHKCHVQTGDVRFIRSDLLLTSGETDNCVMQWRVV